MARALKALASVLIVGLLLVGSAYAGPGGHVNSGDPEIPNGIANPDGHGDLLLSSQSCERSLDCRADAAIEQRDIWTTKVLRAYLRVLRSFRLF